MHQYNMQLKTTMKQNLPARDQVPLLLISPRLAPACFFIMSEHFHFTVILAGIRAAPFNTYSLCL